MKFLSLFSGIGGFDLGLERAGMECIGQVENNEFCNKVLAKHWPDVKRIGDIKNVKANSFKPVDLVCGGFPCQPFSVAGKRKGAGDDRYLWPEMFRVISAYKPAWVIGENVAGIVEMVKFNHELQMDGKKYTKKENAERCLDIDRVCEREGSGILYEIVENLEQIGYEVLPFIIPACAVGAWHRRDRIWIIAYSANNGRNRNDQRCRDERKVLQNKEQSGDRRTSGVGGCDRLSTNTGLEHGEGNPELQEHEKENRQRTAIEHKRSIKCDKQGINTNPNRCGYIHREFEKQSTKAGEYALGKPIKCFGNASNPTSERLERSNREEQTFSECARFGGNPEWKKNWIETATELCGSSHGVSDRVHRLKALGNAVVPQVVEILGRCIMEIEKL
jgi:DNA (cytosine-5)-methyltransferase 1